MDSRTWMDLTLRPPEDTVLEVDIQPDNTVEVSWTLAGESRATILLKPDIAKELNNRLGELLMLIPSDALIPASTS